MTDHNHPPRSFTPRINPPPDAAHLARMLESEEQRAAAEANDTDLAQGPAIEGAALWRVLDRDEPAPSARLRVRFERLLRQHQAAPPPSLLRRFDRWLEERWPSRPSLQLAGAAGALLLGLWLGGVRSAGTAGRGAAAAPPQLAADQQLFDLLQQPAPAERLRAVAASHSALESEPAEGTRRIITGLLHALASDPSENVRLAAVEALENVADQRFVQRGLAVALPSQRSPLLQVTVAELLTSSGARESAAALERLLDQPALDPAVRARAYELLEALAATSM